MALSFEDVDMVFPDGTETLRGVNLTVAPGQLTSIVGPSGCGKTTLLRIAAGLETNTGGTVTIDRRNLGYVFQDSTLMEWRTVRRNVELLAELRGVPQQERRTRAEAAIRTVGLAGFEDHFPSELSGGMRMRASIARSLMMRPPVFLFDEPFSSVDEITRETLQSELIRVFLESGFAGLFVTHSITEAVFLSGRVLVMSPRPGRMVADISVPFAYPRSPAIRFEPEFAQLAGRVATELRDAR
jgi:NitT/TauT family transport system ATP-binding protein